MPDMHHNGFSEYVTLNAISGFIKNGSSYKGSLPSKLEYDNVQLHDTVIFNARASLRNVTHYGRCQKKILVC